MRSRLFVPLILFALVLSVIGAAQGRIVYLSDGDFPYEVEITDAGTSENSIEFDIEPGYVLEEFSFQVRTRGEMSFVKDSIYISGPESVRTEDLNNDGLSDVIVGTRYANYLFQNLGMGQFNLVQEFGLSYTQEVEVNDLDMDGDLDLTFPGQTGESIIYENLGEFQFRAHGLGDHEVSTTCGDWADVDLDGDLDLMMANSDYPGYDTCQDYLFINQGNFEFLKYDALNSGHTLIVRSAYIDIDEYPDFYTIGDGEIRFHINDGTGLKYNELIVDEEMQSYDADLHVASTHVIDLDYDGDNDITITRDDVIMIFENVNGTFVVNSEMEFPPYFCRVDMDQDGLHDIINFHEGLSIITDAGGERNVHVVDDVTRWFGAGSIDDLDADSDEDIVAHGYDQVFIYTNLLVDTQRVDVTEQVRGMIEGQYGKRYLDIAFPDREVLEVFDVVVRFSEEPVDDHIMDPDEYDNDHDGYTDDEEVQGGTDPDDEYEYPKEYIPGQGDDDIRLEGDEIEDGGTLQPLDVSRAERGPSVIYLLIGLIAVIIGAVIPALAVGMYFLIKDTKRN
ncbi:MAG: FG-GAP-like repeat-containing protein [Thermoplasmatota archaeon]